MKAGLVDLDCAARGRLCVVWGKIAVSFRFHLVAVSSVVHVVIETPRALSYSKQSRANGAVCASQYCTQWGRASSGS